LAYVLRTCEKMLYGMVSKCMPTARLHELVQNMYIGHTLGIHWAYIGHTLGIHSKPFFFHICTVHFDLSNLLLLQPMHKKFALKH